MALRFSGSRPQKGGVLWMALRFSGFWAIAYTIRGRPFGSASFFACNSVLCLAAEALVVQISLDLACGSFLECLVLDVDFGDA